MSFSFPSFAGTGTHVCGHNNKDADGNPTGGYAVDGDAESNHGELLVDFNYHKAEVPVRGTIKTDRFRIRWQDGPLNRERKGKPNGAFVEDVLEVCKIRLQFYQDSPFGCIENAEAIEHIQHAIDAMTKRRDDRAARGVLGKNEK